MATSTIKSPEIKNYGASVTDIDNLLYTGYGYTSSATGTPSGSANGTILVFRNSANAVLQIYLPASGSPKYRTQITGSWRDWKDFT